MARPREETRAYQRGYNRGYAAGRAGAWPEWQPPVPPGAVGAAVRALSELRSAVDTLLGGIEPDDPWALVLKPLTDAAAEALAGVTSAALAPPPDG